MRCCLARGASEGRRQQSSPVLQSTPSPCCGQSA
jgi:hypothetical protein